MKKLILEFTEVKKNISALDKKVVMIFLFTAILQTCSWYFASRRFFRDNFAESFAENYYGKLYEFLYWFSADSVVFLFIPLLIIIFLFKEKPSAYGIQLGDAKLGLSISFLFLGVMFLIVWFVSATESFAITYPHLGNARIDWELFFYYELGIFTYLFAWEFIWRGFMLFGLEKKFGYYSVFIQMIPFVILHNGKPFLETFGSIFGGIALGVLAFRTRSMIYCFITHAGVMFMIDFISTLRYRTEDFGIGFSSLINILKYLFVR